MSKSTSTTTATNSNRATDSDDEDANTNPLAGLSGFQRDLLTVLHRTPNERVYGLGIKELLEREAYDDINHGRLYPNLDELVANDLVEKGKLDQRTNWYALTDAGRKRLEDYLAYAGGAK